MLQSNTSIYDIKEAITRGEITEEYAVTTIW